MQPTERPYSWTDFVKTLFQLLGDKKRAYIAWFVLLVAANFTSILPALFLAEIVQTLTNGVSSDAVYRATLLGAALGFCSAAAAYVRLTVKRALGDYRAEVLAHYRARAFDRLVSISHSHQDTTSAGEKVARIQNGVSSFTQIFNMLQNEFLMVAVTITGAVVVFGMIEPLYSFFFLFYLSLFTLILRYSYKTLATQSEQLAAAQEQASSSYVEGLGNALTLRATGSLLGMSKTFAERELQVRNADRAIRYSATRIWQVFQMFNGLFVGIFLALIARDVASGSQQVSAIIIFFGYMERLIVAAVDVMTSYQTVISQKINIGRMVRTVEKLQPEQDGTAMFPEHWDEIALRNIEFRYASQNPNEERPFRFHVDFAVKRGEKLGVIGQSGSGKSTLVRILIGLIKPTSGHYLIGEVPYDAIMLDERNKHFAIVLQETELLNLTLRENITLFREVEPELVHRAVALAELSELVAALPQGLDTLVGEKGYRLSGGERQRIGIARALCRSPQILILDEATSALDSGTEELIQENLEKALTDTTVITVAHRTTTLRNADRIIEFKEGTASELMTRSRST